MKTTITYIDKKLGFRRLYSLSDDTLVIIGKKWFGSSYRSEITLKRLKEEPDKHRMKDDTQNALVGMPGLVIFMIGVFGGATFYEKNPMGFYAILAGGLTAMVFGFILGGRIRVYVFKSREEIPVFDIADRGSQHDAFEVFITELKMHIRLSSEQGK